MTHDFSLVFDTEHEYWQKILEIFKKNECFPKKKARGRALHHKFPKCFSRMLGEETDNSEDNLISLTFGDHFMIHYYYYKIAKGKYKPRMALAFSYMINTSLENMNKISYDDAYKISKLYEDNFIDICDNIGKIHLGHIFSEKARESLKLGWIKRKEKGVIYIPTEETKQKQSKALSGLKKSKEHCKHISEGRKGMKFTKEHCKNQQESRNKTLQNMSEEERKEKFGKARKGKHFIFSEEHKRHMSKVRIGKKASEETKRKLSESHKGKLLGRKCSEDHKKNISNAKKGVKRGPMSEEQKKKISSKIKGRHWKLVNGIRVWD